MGEANPDDNGSIDKNKREDLMATMGNKNAQEAAKIATSKVEAVNNPVQFRDLFLEALDNKDADLMSELLKVMPKILAMSPLTPDEEQTNNHYKKKVETLKKIQAPKIVIENNVEQGLRTFVGPLDRLVQTWKVLDGN